MEQPSSAVRVAVHSLLSLLAEGGGRHAALSLLHERALQVTGGHASILFEPHPTTGHLHPTSGASLELLALDPWVPAPGEAALVARAFGRLIPVAVPGLADEMPRLHAQLRTSGAVLLPLAIEDRRVGLLAVGVNGDLEQVSGDLAASEVSGGFTLALELTRLRQREAFEHDVRQLLDEFTQQAMSTFDLRAALHPMCTTAARLFGADRLTVWLHDRVSRALQPIVSSDATFVLRDAPVRADDPLVPAAAALRAHGAGIAAQPGAVTATLTVPLRGYRRALGTLVFDGVRIEAGEDLALLTRADELGRRLANAIETTQLLAAVGASRPELDDLLDAIPYPLVVVDDAEGVVRCNNAFAAAAGRTTDELRGTPLEGLISSELLDWIRDYPGEGAANRVRTFDEPRLGGRYEVTVRSVSSQQHRSLRVVTARQLSI